MRNRILTTACFLSLGLAAAQADAVATNDIKAAEQGICKLLNDCVTPQFQNEVIKPGKNGERVVCGEFRAFDISGGYGPYERFVAYPKQQPMIKQTVPAVFEMVWHSVCDVEPPPAGMFR